MTAEVVWRGRMWTPGLAGPTESALAARDGRILARGQAALDLIGPGTTVHDAGSGLLVPGFIDAHVHPVQGGLERMRCDLTEGRTSDEYLSTIAAYAREHPEREWILGGGWRLEAFPGGTPTAAALDTVVGDRPVYLPNRDHHGAWVNTAALRLADIDERTPDPVDGHIVRDDAGRPTGNLHEGATQLVARVIPADMVDDQVEGLLVAQEYLHSLGITGWQDAIVGAHSGFADSSGAYTRLDGDGRLTARVVGALWWERERGLEQLPGLVTARRELSGRRFLATSVKIMQDGVPETFTAAMLEPYTDPCGCRSLGTGMSFVDPERLGTYVSALDAEGFQVHVHAIGDRAVREALDAIEEARRRNGPTDGRHQLAHIQVVHPEDVPRFGALGAVANMQPLWATHEPQMDDLTIPYLGPERSRWQYPFAGLERSGAHLAAGSDWPVSTPDPLAGIHVAVNRSLPPSEGEVREPFLPQEALSLQTALTAYTAGSAYANHADDAGRLEVGALADAVLLDRDVFAGEAAAIAEASVVATWVGGAAVFVR
jgi:hypothetical protein